MKPIVRNPLLDRRVLLSSMAMLPLLSTSLRSTVRTGAGAGRSTAVLERGGDENVDPRLRRAGHDAERALLRTSDQRIATFDNDGTLWVEQPMYIQLAFALDRVKALAPMHPEWKDKQPFAAVLDGD